MDSEQQKKDENCGANRSGNDETIFLNDLLREQEQMEEDVEAVLGGSDENSCTYSEGYVKRQALYACVTCVPEAKTDPKKRAGICLGCSYRCHDGHEFIELYTKRNFRCDCGTSKILSVRCKFDSNKMEDNENNKYNHNFSGTYCICQRPYPDPENENEDEMIQCIGCEDWFHLSHLESKDVPDVESFDEMICAKCTKQNPFLQYYSHLSIFPKNVSAPENLDVSVSDDKTQAKAANPDKEDDTKEKKGASENESAKVNDSIGCAGPSTSDDSPPTKKLKTEDENKNISECRKPKTIWKQFDGASFWTTEWRKSLCQCADCLAIYEKNDVKYLIDMEDTTQHYVEKGKAKERNSSEQMLMNAISNMDHVAKIEAITAFNTLKDKLTEFFTSFTASKDVITEKDVHNFFQSMKEKKN